MMTTSTKSARSRLFGLAVASGLLASAAQVTAQEFRAGEPIGCLLYTSPSPRDYAASRMPSSA